MNDLLLSTAVVIVGEGCLLLDLGNRLFGSYSRTPAQALWRIGVVAAAGVLLGLPLALAFGQARTTADAWLLASCLLSLVIAGHYLFPWRFGIRRARKSVTPAPERPLSCALGLETVTVECALPATERKSISVLLLSDLHCNTPRRLATLAEAFRSLREREYDLVFILGDLTENKAILPDILRELATLHGKHGTFCVRGNHDFEMGRADIIADLAPRNSITLLANKACWVPELGLSVIGLEHPWRPGPPPVIAGSTFSIGLTHTPDNFALLARLQVPLVLAGHTHGGKLVLPWIGSILVPSRYGRLLDKGWFAYRDAAMYVTPGVGYFPGLAGRRGIITELEIRNASVAAVPPTRSLFTP